MAWILPKKRPIYRRFIGDKFEFSAKNRRLLPQSTRLPARVVHSRFFHRFFGSFRFFGEKSPIKPIFYRFFWQTNFPCVFLFLGPPKNDFSADFSDFFVPARRSSQNLYLSYGVYTCSEIPVDITEITERILDLRNLILYGSTRKYYWIKCLL